MEQASKVTMPNKYTVGTIVYLLAPTISELVTSSKKIVASYIGPLVIREIVSRDKALLCDLAGQKINGLYHFRRLKIGYVHLGLRSTNQISEVRREMNKLEIKEARKTLLMRMLQK